MSALDGRRQVPEKGGEEVAEMMSAKDKEKYIREVVAGHRLGPEEERALRELIAAYDEEGGGDAFVDTGIRMENNFPVAVRAFNEYEQFAAPGVRGE